VASALPGTEEQVKHIGKPRLRAALLAVAVGLAASALAVAPAQAAPGPWSVDTTRASAPPAGQGRMIEARLGLDCGKLSGKAREYADQRGYCRTGPSANTVVDGPCGKAWLFVIDDVVGDGWGRINFGVSSTLGTIVYRNFTVSWAFTPQGPGSIQSGYIYNSGAMFSSVFDISYVRNGGPGLAGAQLTGYVYLVWGGSCQVLPPYPSDFRAVT
jgi:hypothetical protein